MRLLLILLLFLCSCNSKLKQIPVSGVKINSIKLNEFIQRFIKDEKRKITINEIIVTVQQNPDTTYLYLTDGGRPDFTKGDILGCTYVSNVLVWFKGNILDESFISAEKNKSDTLVEAVTRNGSIVEGHPLQWTLRFKGNDFIGCQSNISRSEFDFNCDE